jgi:hypothetical protein
MVVVVVVVVVVMIVILSESSGVSVLVESRLDCPDGPSEGKACVGCGRDVIEQSPESRVHVWDVGSVQGYRTVGQMSE